MSLQNTAMLILFCITGRESDAPQADTTTVTVQETMSTGKVISAYPK